MTPELDPLSRQFPVWDFPDLAAVVAAVRAELAQSGERSSPTLDEFLGAMQSWLLAYPQPYLDAGGVVEDMNGRLFADSLITAASGGTLSKRWRASVDFDEDV